MADKYNVDRNRLIMDFAVSVSSPASINLFLYSEKNNKCIGCIGDYNGECVAGCVADECKKPLFVSFSSADGQKLKKDNKVSRKRYYEEMYKIFSWNKKARRDFELFSDDEPIGVEINKLYSKVVRQLVDLENKHDVNGNKFANGNELVIYFAQLLYSAAELNVFFGGEKDKCIGCIANFNGECVADECKGSLVVSADGQKFKRDAKTSRKQYYEEMCKIFQDD